MLTAPRTDPYERDYRIRLLPWMSRVEANHGIGVQDSGLGQPPRADLVEVSPVHPPLLAASAEPLPPQPSQARCRYRCRIRGHSNSHLQRQLTVERGHLAYILCLGASGRQGMQMALGTLFKVPNKRFRSERSAATGQLADARRHRLFGNAVEQNSDGLVRLTRVDLCVADLLPR